MRSIWLFLPLVLAACSGGSGDGTTHTGLSGDDDDDTSLGDDDDTVTGDDDDDTTTGPAHACHTGTPTLSIGNGAGMFTPLATGADVVLVHGPQGGWHIDLGGEVSGFSDLVEVEGYVRVAGEGRTIAGEEQQPSRLALVGWSDSTCSGTFYDVRAFVDDEGQSTLDYICALDGAPLEIEITVTDLADPTGAWSATETLSAVAALDPNDVEPCATR